ncbi:MAG: hypothetical protein ACP5M4_13860, partial [Acidobacteriaceae bacterium]
QIIRDQPARSPAKPPQLSAILDSNDRLYSLCDSESVLNLSVRTPRVNATDVIFNDREHRRV